MGDGRLRYPTPPKTTRLSWAEVRQAAQAVRRARQENLWQRSDMAVTPERLIAHCDAQRQFSPPLRPWEVWAVLAVTDPGDIALLNWYVTALQHGQQIFVDSPEARQLRALWTRLVDTTV